MQEYTNSEIIRIIEERVHSERDRKLLCRRLVDGITCEKLAEEFGLSDRQTRKILKNYRERLFA